jgi:CheY-like chemotaxis protein
MRPSQRDGGPTVLLVDDEGEVRRALRKIFERGGLTVLEADSGRVALDTLATDPGIAAVVSDFIMPELDGLDFYDALVARSQIRQFCRRSSSHFTILSLQGRPNSAFARGGRSLGPRGEWHRGCP